MKLMLSSVLSAAVLASASTSAIAAESYTVDPRHTYPVFEVKHLGYSTQRGRFNATSGKIMLDRAAKKGSIDVTIDTSSLDMGLAKWDEHLKSEDFFNVAKYPTITFKSNSLKFDGDNLVGADGNLTLLGKTKPVTLAVTYFKCQMHPVTKKDTCGADVTTTVKRSEFGMDYGLPGIGDEIKLILPVEAIKD